jgi:hypothetical protein
MTFAETLSIIAIAVSIASFVNAHKARQLAKHTAALSPRTQAIDHLRDAVKRIQEHRVVNPVDIRSMKDAKDRADLVFNDTVRDDLARLIEEAEHLHQARMSGRPQSPEALVAKAEDLITRMKTDAALR